MAGIAEMTRGLIVGYSQISEDAQKLFQTEALWLSANVRAAGKASTRAKRTTTAEPKLPVCHVEE